MNAMTAPTTSRRMLSGFISKSYRQRQGGTRGRLTGDHYQHVAHMPVFGLVVRFAVLVLPPQACGRTAIQVHGLPHLKVLQQSRHGKDRSELHQGQVIRYADGPLALAVSHYKGTGGGWRSSPLKGPVLVHQQGPALHEPRNL